MVDYNLIVEQLYLVSGDVKNKNWLFEAKTCVKEQESFNIKREWLEKLKSERFAMRKDYSALVFNFGKGENYFILNEKDFKQILELLNDVE